MIFQKIRMFCRKRFIRKELRRAHAWLKAHKEGRDIEHYQLFQKISTEVGMGIPEKGCRWLVDEADEQDAQTCLRQLLFNAGRNSKLYSEIILQQSGMPDQVKAPLPATWRQAFRQNGVKVNTIVSLYRLFQEQIKYLREFLAVVLRIYRAQKAGNNRVTQPYNLFLNVREFYLPYNDDPQSWDMITWYRRSCLNDHETKEIWVKCDEDTSQKNMAGIRTVQFEYPHLDKEKWPGFLWAVIRLFSLTLVGMLVGKWWLPFLLSNAVELEFFKRVKTQDLPKQVGFNSTQKIIRPLWTYDAQRRGSRVMVFLYSKNVSVFIPGKPEIPGSAPDFAQASWPEYVIWDEDHKNELISVGVQPDVTFTMVGPVGFADTDIALPIFKKPSITVFDVDSLRNVDCAQMGYARPYWTHDTIMAFAEGCFKAIRAVGATPVYKPKAYINGRFLRPRAQLFDDLVKKYDVQIVDGLIHAHRIIDATEASISMPFTSTANGAAYLGKPSVFYDPTNLLGPHEHLADGVPIIYNSDDLEKWLKETLSDIA